MQVTNLSNWADFSSPTASPTPEALDAWADFIAEQREKWPGLY